MSLSTSGLADGLIPLTKEVVVDGLSALRSSRSRRCLVGVIPVDQVVTDVIILSTSVTVTVTS